MTATIGKVAIAIAISALCALPQWVHADGKQTTGIVVDEDTKAPLAGAYVLAAYHQPRRVQGTLVDTSCVKLMGMYTGADGRFSFPLERLDGYSPLTFLAIAPGYYAGVPRRADGSDWEDRTLKDYTDLRMYMRRQDPANPNFQYSSGDEYCDHTKTPGEGAAGTEFIRAKVREMTRLGAPPQVIERLQQTIAARQAREGGAGETK